MDSSLVIYGLFSLTRLKIIPTWEELEDIARILLKDSRLKYGLNGHVIPRLHMAAAYGHTPILKILLEQSDMDVNAVRLRNSTALDFAA